MIYTRKTIKKAITPEMALEAKRNEARNAERYDTGTRDTGACENGTRGTGAHETGGPAILVLEDGTSFVGQSCGAKGEVCGEICFNTAMIGYPEIISDPAYAGTVLVFTYPQIGNYGIAREDLESDRAALRGLVVRDICHTPSNFRSDLSLPDYLVEQGIVALSGIDTRSLLKYAGGTRPIWALLSTEGSHPGILQTRLLEYKRSADKNLVAAVSVKAPWDSRSGEATGHGHFLSSQVAWHAPYPVPRCRVVAIDCGITRSELRHLARAACSITLLPWDSSVDAIMSYKPDGIFISGGPGHPEASGATLEALSGLMGQIPILGTGLGHQLIVLAAGGRVEMMKAPHFGANHPVLELETRKVSATMQRHRYTVDFASLGARGAASTDVVDNERYGLIQLTHIHADDKSVEGLRFLDIPIVSAQFDPAFLPDAAEPHPLYAEFVKMMEAWAKERPKAPVEAPAKGFADERAENASGTEADHA